MEELKHKATNRAMRTAGERTVACPSIPPEASVRSSLDSAISLLADNQEFDYIMQMEY